MVWLNKIVQQVWLVFTSRHTFSKNLLPFDPPLLYRTSSSFHWQLLKLRKIGNRDIRVLFSQV